jgi:hypothetical protein
MPSIQGFREARVIISGGDWAEPTAFTETLQLHQCRTDPDELS